MRASVSSRLVSYSLYALFGLPAIIFLLNNALRGSVQVRLLLAVRSLPGSSVKQEVLLQRTDVQRSDVFHSTHQNWLPYTSKESLSARIESLEEQLYSAQQALHAVASNTQEASIQRTASISPLKQLVRGKSDVSEALSIVSASVESQDALDVAPATTQQKNSSGLEGMPPGSTVFVTFVNGDEKYRELMINWALHLRAIQVWYVVVAFDDKAAAACAEQDIPYIRCGSFPLFLALWIADFKH